MKAEILKQGTYFNFVRRLSEDEVLSEACCIESNFEGSAALIFNPTSFKVKDASWGIHHAPNPERRGEGKIPDIIGLSAYADDREISSKKIPDYSLCVPYNLPPGGWIFPVEPKSAVLDAPDSENISPEWIKIRECINETLRGAYQSEFSLLEERGLNSLENYEIMWNSPQRENYCRPYIKSHMPYIVEWPEHTGAVQHYRKRDLYNKYLSFKITDEGNDLYTCFGSFHDSYHEMSISCKCSRYWVIRDVDISLMRVPYELCSSLDYDLEFNLEGQILKGMSKHELGKLIGGPKGCFHLLDIVAAMASAVNELK